MGMELLGVMEMELLWQGAVKGDSSSGMLLGRSAWLPQSTEGG
jgi:hypothetical protein